MPQPLLITPSQCPVDTVRTAQLRYLLTGEQTGGTLAIVELTDVAGSGVPPHIHTREDETFHVLEGEVEFTIGTTRRLARAGDVLFGARGVAHGFKALTPVRLLTVITPAGIEQLLRELARLSSRGSDTVAAGALAAAYGVTYVAP